MFSKEFIRRTIKTLVFVAIYTVLFFIFIKTIRYTIPFVLAFFIAALARPLTRFLRVRMHASDAVAALCATLLTFSVVFSLLFALIYQFTIQAQAFIMNLDPELVKQFYTVNASNFFKWVERFDPVVVQSVKDQLQSLTSTVTSFAQGILSYLLSITVTIPYLLMVILFTLLATYFIIKEMPRFRDSFLSIFAQSAREKVENAMRESQGMVYGYIKAYLILLSSTGIITFAGFTLLGIPYAFILSIVGFFVDALPVLGIGTLYFFVGLYYFFTGNYFILGGIIAMNIFMTFYRQIMEPRLLSKTVGIHPLAALAALFIGLSAFGFSGVIYLILLMILYNIFRKVGIL